MGGRHLDEEGHWQGSSCWPWSVGTQNLCCCREGEGQGEGWNRLSQWHITSQEPPSHSC